ncbi:hypothetical protein ACLMJK_007587 [Lecanora helva]
MFSDAHQPRDIHAIEIWPDGSSEGLEGTSSKKVPSEIRNSNGHREWGFQIGEGFRHRFFKLDLDPHRLPSRSELASKYASGTDDEPAYNVDDVVIEYLTALREHTEHYLMEKLSSAALRQTPIEYIITTPAVWSDAGQARTRRCAEAAGMGKGDALQIISEPEAAAVYAFEITHPHNIRVGDTFVLCDAGGGTVDLISYTVTATSPILAVDEAAPGSGGLCGGMLLNRIFEKHLTQTCKSNSGWGPDVMEDATKRFELIKQQFIGDVAKDFTIPVNGLNDNEDQGVRRGKWRLSCNKLSTIFAPVLEDTIDLVKRQIEATQRNVTAILLVGGWGQNAYLRESLRQQLGADVKVMQPENGWQAVVRGALMKALAQASPSSATMKFGSRRARKHYGIENGTPFLSTIHDFSRSNWSDFEGEYRVLVMNWLIKKGDPVKEAEPTVIYQYIKRRVREGLPASYKLPIYWSSSSSGAPTYCDNGVKHLVDLTVDFSKLPELSVKRETGYDGELWYKIDYEIIMTNHSASTSYALRYKGKEYDSVTADIYKHIGPGERVALSKLAVEQLEDTGRPLRIAIDISIWQFQIQSGQGGRNPALRTLYYRLLRLLALSVQPLFVFDGPHKPPFKRGKKTVPGAACLPDFLTKELLKQFGFPYHTAPGEAEAECALFQKEGLVDAVLSEDVDTLMFGCTLSLRNWSNEGTRCNKSPTHVNSHRAERTKEASGLDSEGMILVALMSGGDYIPAGMPGCGPKTACEAAKAGFGKELCRIPKGYTAGLNEWRERFRHELHTNDSKFFRQKHKALKVPEDFPNMKVLGYYTNPVVSSKDKISKLRQELTWNGGIKVSELRTFVADAFNWPCISGAKKFIRGLAPALLTNQLIRRSNLAEDETTVEAKEAAEASLVNAISDRRSHWNTDGMHELRVAYIPNDITRIDLDAEEVDYQIEDASEDDQPGSPGEDGIERSARPTKKRGPSTYDPTKVEKIWVLETYVKLGVPLLVETWEEDMRDPKKFASRKARTKKILAKANSGPEKGATKGIDQYVKVTKPSRSRVSDRENSAVIPKSLQEMSVSSTPAIRSPQSSPRKKAVTNGSSLVKQSLIEQNQKIPRQRDSTTVAKTKPSMPSTKSHSIKSIEANPWTLSKRPPDTLRFKSPTRYSALGIYPFHDLDDQNTTRITNTLVQTDSKPFLSPPASPSPKKRHSRPTTPTSDSDPRPSSPTMHLPNTTTPSKPRTGLSTPRTHDYSKPSPRKKRTPLEQANDLYLTGQLRTPTSLRKETMLDRFIERGNEGLTGKKVNRRLDFSAAERRGGWEVPVDDEDELPELVTLMSPKASNEKGDIVEMVSLEVSASPARGEEKARRLVALRESLEGAWKHLDPGDSAVKAARKVYSSVEVVDLTSA